jgi:hypothetical protein
LAGLYIYYTCFHVALLSLRDAIRLWAYLLTRASD